MLALYALSYWMQRRLFALGSIEASVQALTISFPNYAAAGLPLIGAVFDPSRHYLRCVGGRFGLRLALAFDVGHSRGQQVIRGRIDGLGPCFSRRGALAANPVVLSPIIGIAVRSSAFRSRTPSARLSCSLAKPRAVWRCSSLG